MVAEQPIEWCRLENAIAGALGDPPPERPQHLPRTRSPADGHAVDEHGTVHGARAGAADAVYHQALVLQQAIEHPPRKSAVGAATLKRQTHRLSLCRTLL